MCSAILLYTLKSAALSLGSFGSSAFSTSTSLASHCPATSHSFPAGGAALSAGPGASADRSAMTVPKSCAAGGEQVKLRLQNGYWIAGMDEAAVAARLPWVATADALRRRGEMKRVRRRG